MPAQRADTEKTVDLWYISFDELTAMNRDTFMTKYSVLVVGKASKNWDGQCPRLLA